MPPSRGDVILVLYPDSSLRTAKRRPALVVQQSGLNTGLPQSVVAMITSNMARARHASRVEVRLGSVEARHMGLRTDSVIMTDNLATVLHREIDRSIGHCTNMQPIDDALRHTLGL